MGKTALRQGVNDLATLLPELVQEWDHERNAGLSPRQVHAATTKKLWWLCPLGHSYAATGESRLAGTGCPYCANKAVMQGFNDLETLNPSLAKEWDIEQNLPLRASNVVPGSSKKVWWRCQLGHSWKAMVVNRHRYESKCPFCSGRLPIVGETDLATTNPSLAKEWDVERNGSLSPSQVKAGSEKKVWWKCPLGHEWSASIAARSAGNSCPVCSNRTIESGINDLASKHPELMTEWDFSRNSENPSELPTSFQGLVWWLCPEGHSYQARPANRAGQATGCPICSGRQVLSGFNDLETTHPKLAALWNFPRNDGSPDSITRDSRKRFWWICDHGHEWEASATALKGCPFCQTRGRNRIWPGFNDLATTNPELIGSWDFERNKRSPKDVSKGHNEKIYWKCELGHSWATQISNRIAGKGCPYCSGSLVLSGFNDLQTRFPNLAAEFDIERNGGKLPSQILAGGHSKMWWRCDEGHEWEAATIDRANGRGCPSCANYGYDPSRPGLFYYLEHERFKASKVGITNLGRRSDRLGAFKMDGWRIVRTIEDGDGSLIRKLETAMLSWIRVDLQLPPYLSRSEMRRTGGHSETFSSAGIDRSQVLNRIEQTIMEMKSGTRKT